MFEAQAENDDMKKCIAPLFPSVNKEVSAHSPINASLSYDCQVVGNDGDRLRQNGCHSQQGAADSGVKQDIVLYEHCLRFLHLEVLFKAMTLLMPSTCTVDHKQCNRKTFYVREQAARAFSISLRLIQVFL